MFRKKQRLTTSEFDYFFKKGKRFHSPTIQIIYTPQADFKAAVVVGKKVYKQAVKRNLLRRRLYSQLFNFQKEHSLTGVYLVLVKPAAKNLTKKEINNDLVTVLGNIK